MQFKPNSQDFALDNSFPGWRELKIHAYGQVSTEAKRLKQGRFYLILTRTDTDVTARPALLLYIHGFKSSPLSHKAHVMQQYCQQHRPDIKVVVPKLPSIPAQAAQHLLSVVEQYRAQYRIGLVGSSLGGYVSTWLNAQFGFRAVLINNAVKSYELLADFLGEQVNPYTQEHYVLEACHIDELKALDTPVLKQQSDFG